MATTPEQLDNVRSVAYRAVWDTAVNADEEGNAK